MDGVHRIRMIRLCILYRSYSSDLGRVYSPPEGTSAWPAYLTTSSCRTPHTGPGARTGGRGRRCAEQQVVHEHQTFGMHLAAQLQVIYVEDVKKHRSRACR